MLYILKHFKAVDINIFKRTERLFENVAGLKMECEENVIENSVIS